MLKGIPAIISPELLKVLSEMGHGDEIVLADGTLLGLVHSERLREGDDDIIVRSIGKTCLFKHLAQRGIVVKTPYLGIDTTLALRFGTQLVHHGEDIIGSERHVKGREDSRSALNNQAFGGSPPLHIAQTRTAGARHVNMAVEELLSSRCLKPGYHGERCLRCFR